MRVLFVWKWKQMNRRGKRREKGRKEEKKKIVPCVTKQPRPTRLWKAGRRRLPIVEWNGRNQTKDFVKWKEKKGKNRRKINEWKTSKKQKVNADSKWKRRFRKDQDVKKRLNKMKALDLKARTMQPMPVAQIAHSSPPFQYHSRVYCWPRLELSELWTFDLAAGTKERNWEGEGDVEKGRKIACFVRGGSTWLARCTIL